MPRFIGDSLQRGVGTESDCREKKKKKTQIRISAWTLELSIVAFLSFKLLFDFQHVLWSKHRVRSHKPSADLMWDSPLQGYFIKVGQLRKSKQIMMVLEGAVMMKLCKLKARLMTTQIQMSLCQVNSMTICSPQVDTLIYSLSVQPSFRTFSNLSQSFSENNNLLVLAKILIP